MSEFKTECLNWLREFDQYIYPGVKTYALIAVLVLSVFILPEAKLTYFVQLMIGFALVLLRAAK